MLEVHPCTHLLAVTLLRSLPRGGPAQTQEGPDPSFSPDCGAEGGEKDSTGPTQEQQHERPERSWAAGGFPTARTVWGARHRAGEAADMRIFIHRIKSTDIPRN